MSTTPDPAPPGTPAQEADREGAIESLLLEGLDAYFAEQYERAIHAWERVLFADRGHARARAYIERARRVIAERQRVADASLQSGIDAFNSGDVEAARALLLSVVHERGADEQALALLQRLERLGAPAAPPAEAPPRPAPSVRPVVSVAPRPSRKGYIVLAVVGVAILAGASWLTLNWDAFDPGRSRSAPTLPASTFTDTQLHVPRLSESSLVRARGLYARGHLHEALRAAEAVRDSDPLKPEADRLRAEIQRALLAASGASRMAAEPGGGDVSGTVRQ
jgi:tetratricopeptide (TPR) repeat protein